MLNSKYKTVMLMLFRCPGNAVGNGYISCSFVVINIGSIGLGYTLYKLKVKVLA